MKLYVLIREDLSHSQRIVQCGHAIAEFCRNYPNSDWQYRSLVILSVRDKIHLGLWLERCLEFPGVELTSFQEPWWNNDLTSFAILGTVEICELFKELPLV
jgi:hypothetical protein